MKRLLFVQHHAPHGTLNGQEGLDAILMGSAFAQCSVLMLDDAVFQLVANQNTSALGSKHYALSYAVLPDYGVPNIYCSEVHLHERGLNASNLLIDVTPVSNSQIISLFKNHNVILSF